MGTIAVLGTGLLGAGFAEKALNNGYAVRVWNRTAAKCAPLVALGATQGSDPADTVAGCERIHLVLRADDAVDEVIDALRPGLEEGAWIVDHSTNLPARVAERCARLRGLGVQYIHAPVFMGPSNSRSGTGEMLISGPMASIDSLRTALMEMTGKLSVIGPRDEDAAVRKLIGNGLIIGLSALAGDLLAIGRAGGFDDQRTMEFIHSFSPMTARLAQRVAEHEQREVTFELAMARKDVALMTSTGGAEHLTLLTALGVKMDALIKLGRGAENYTAVSMPNVTPTP